jgi:fucose permease
MTRTRLGLLALAFLGFVGVGVAEGLLGVAWPEMRAQFALPQAALGELLALVTTGYVAASFGAGWALRRVRLGAWLALAAGASAAALLGYAVAPAWALLVPFGLLAGLGAGAIDAGLNAYVATRHDARAVNWLHACFGVGASASPAVLGAVLAHGLPWQRGYALAGAAELALAAAFALSSGAWPPTPSGVEAADGAAGALRETLRLPAARWSAAAFFAYTGLEAAAGAWSYSLLALARGFDVAVAASWVSGFWLGLTAGRVAAGALAGALRAPTMLAGALGGVALSAACVWLAPVHGAELAGVAGLGLAAGPIFPTLIALTPNRVGPAHVANAVGLQIASAALGQAAFPAAVGIAAGAFGLEAIGPALCVAAVALAAIVWRLQSLR